MGVQEVQGMEEEQYWRYKCSRCRYSSYCDYYVVRHIEHKHKDGGATVKAKQRWRYKCSRCNHVAWWYYRRDLAVRHIRSYHGGATVQAKVGSIVFFHH